MQKIRQHMTLSDQHTTFKFNADQQIASCTTFDLGQFYVSCFAFTCTQHINRLIETFVPPLRHKEVVIDIELPFTTHTKPFSSTWRKRV